jgi:hypothetical protein
MALAHPVYGRPLVLRLAFGTEVPEIDPEDLRGFPIVRLGDVVEGAIANAIERASELRRQANEIEDEAVHLVEQHVEAVLGERIAHVKLRAAPKASAEEAT